MRSSVLNLGLAVIGLAAQGYSQNYLHTSGNQILDSNNKVVRLTGVSWFGFETSTYCPHGLWARTMPSMLDQMKSLGFNVIRVPYATQMLDAGSTVNSIDYGLNPGLQGLTPIQVLDQLVAGAQSRGIKIILDRHTISADTQEPLWYTAQYPESRWIADWQMLAARYRGNDTVIGFDLHNEPHVPATWGDGNVSTDWRLAAERAGNAVLAINPKLLIFVEGIDRNDYYWWGGDLGLAGQYPVQLSVAGQLVYSIHDYPSTVSDSPWFHDAAYPSNLPGIWNQFWGYLVTGNIAPVWIGEFGTADQTASDKQWFSSIASYINTNHLSFTYWCWNPNASDTGGILADDWQTVNANKMALLKPLLAPFIGTGPTVPGAPTGVTAVGGTGQISLSWTAVSGATSYKLYRGTAAGAETLYRSGLTVTSFADSGLGNSATYYYKVGAVNAAGEGAKSAEVKGTTAPPPAAVTVTGAVSSYTNPWWGEDDVYLNNTATLTALTITVTVQNTGGVSFYDQYSAYNAGAMTVSYRTMSTAVVFTYKLNPGWTLPAGSGWLVGSQYNAGGTARSTAKDTYSVTYTAGGASKTLTGHF